MTAIYTTTIFISAFLLFLVQPMIGKMLLPLLGGTPAVWNVVMVFFQGMLLLGYLYAHLTKHIVGVRTQSFVHLALLVVAALTLPVIPPTNIPLDVVNYPTYWVFSTLFLSVGLSFFALAAHAPMLQSWLAHTNHPHAQNPYFLYAASNAASMIALLGYPFIIEPIFGLKNQSHIWTWGFYALILSVGICTFLLHKNYAQLAPVSNEMPVEKIHLKRKLWWLLLAFIPSSLLIGTTSKITTDIASFPLLWIIPLVLYLLSFVFTFLEKKSLYERSINALFPLILFIAVSQLTNLMMIEVGLIFIYLLVLFCVCMICHYRLNLDKPSPQQLTEFYLIMSLGGVLGGIFNALLAPVIFSNTWEFPLILIFACLVCPPATKLKYSWKDIAIPVSAFIFFISVFFLCRLLADNFPHTISLINQWIRSINPSQKEITVMGILPGILILMPLIICYYFRHNPLRFGLTIGIIIFAGIFANSMRENVVHTERNFFGVIQVKKDTPSNIMSLFHGTTVHGLQSTNINKTLETVGYYHKLGPFADVFNATRTVEGRNIAIIGLGVGGMACLAQQDDTITYFEIDPAIDKIARNPQYFSFLDHCPPQNTTLFGDGRITLSASSNNAYDMLVLDAFSSDAIPIHLLTKEAFTLYAQKINDNGVLVIHVSNRYFELEPVISAIAAEIGLHGLHKTYIKPKNLITDLPLFSVHVVVLSKQPEVLNNISNAFPDWKPLSEPNPNMLWTDDYSNILRVFKQ